MTSGSFWDDGSPVDRRSGSSRSRSDRGSKFVARDAAVCRQAERVLLVELMAIPGVTGVRVEAVSGAARLRVAITAAPADLQEVQAVLLRRAAALRRTITGALRRRKAPELCFMFLAEGGGE